MFILFLLLTRQIVMHAINNFVLFVQRFWNKYKVTAMCITEKVVNITVQIHK